MIKQAIHLDSPFFGLARVPVHLNHVASPSVKANQRIMRGAAKLRAVNYVADCVWLAVPKPTERQRIGNQTDAAMIFTRSDFVNVLRMVITAACGWFHGVVRPLGCATEYSLLSIEL